MITSANIISHLSNSKRNASVQQLNPNNKISNTNLNQGEVSFSGSYDSYSAPSYDDKADRQKIVRLVEDGKDVDSLRKVLTDIPRASTLVDVIKGKDGISANSYADQLSFIAETLDTPDLSRKFIPAIAKEIDQLEQSGALTYLKSALQATNEDLEKALDCQVKQYKIAKELNGESISYEADDTIQKHSGIKKFIPFTEEHHAYFNDLAERGEEKRDLRAVKAEFPEEIFLKRLELAREENTIASLTVDLTEKHANLLVGNSDKLGIVADMFNALPQNKFEMVLNSLTKKNPYSQDLQRFFIHLHPEIKESAKKQFIRKDCIGILADKFDFNVLLKETTPKKLPKMMEFLYDMPVWMDVGKHGTDQLIDAISLKSPAERQKLGFTLESKDLRLALSNFHGRQFDTIFPKAFSLLKETEPRAAVLGFASDLYPPEATSNILKAYSPAEVEDALLSITSDRKRFSSREYPELYLLKASETEMSDTIMNVLWVTQPETRDVKSPYFKEFVNAIPSHKHSFFKDKLSNEEKMFTVGLIKDKYLSESFLEKNLTTEEVLSGINKDNFAPVLGTILSMFVDRSFKKEVIETVSKNEGVLTYLENLPDKDKESIANRFYLMDSGNLSYMLRLLHDQQPKAANNLAKALNEKLSSRSTWMFSNKPETVGENSKIVKRYLP